jgi:hypothetical protein
MKYFHFGTILFLAILLTGCQPQITQIHVILPDDTRGIFKLIVDPKGGVEPRIVNKTHVYYIPEGGILTIQSDASFRGLNHLSAFYRNGTRIPVANSAKMFKPDEIALFGPHYEKEGGGTQMWFLVGTVQEIHEVNKAAGRIQK